MSVSSCLNIYFVTLAKILKNSILVPINIGASKQIIKTLIDCGTGGMFINQNFTKKFKAKNLDKLIMAFNVDGTKNKKGMIKSYVDLEFWIKHKKFKEWFYVTGLGKQKIILGFPWLNKHNPIIDWKKGEIKWQPLRIDWKGLLEKRQRIRMEQQLKIEETINKEELKNHMNNLIEEDKNAILIELLEEMTWINKTNVVTELAIKENDKKEKKTDEELVPEEFHNYLDIFSEEKAHQFPKLWPWDHKIKMRKGLNQNHSKIITSHQQNKLNWTNSSKKTWRKATSDHPNHYGFSIFLCQQERWETLTLPRLLVFEWLDHQELLSPFFNFGNHEQVERCKVLYQTTCTLGIQQHTNQKERQIESSFQNE